MSGKINSHMLPALVENGLLPGRLYTQALVLFRNAKAWDGWALRSLLALGTGHFLAGVIFFFAYNWHDLSEAVKFGIVFGGMILSALAWIGLKLDKPIAQVFGISLTVLIGVFLAVFGQVFQTPAAIYVPFTIWTIMALPFAAVSRSLAHWAVWLIIATIAVNTYIGFGLQDLYGREVYFWAYAAVAFIYCVLLFVYDRVQNMWPEWARAGWFRVLLLTIGFVYANAAFATAVLDNQINWAWPVIPIMGVGVLAYLNKLNHDRLSFPPPAQIACLVLAATGLGAMAAQIGLRTIGELTDSGDAFVFDLLLGFIWMAGITFVLAKAFKHFGDIDKHEQNTSVSVNEISDASETVEGYFNPARALDVEVFSSDLQLNAVSVQDVLRAETADTSPWYMELFLGFSGVFTAILAMSFLGTFLAVTLNVDRPEYFLGLGLVVYGGAVFMRLKINGLFPRHFFNTLLMGGGALAVIGAAMFFEGEAGFILFAMLLSALTLWLIHDRILEFLMAAGFAGMLTYALLYYNVPYAFIWLYVVCVIMGIICVTLPSKIGFGKSRNFRVLGAAGAAFLLTPCYFAVTGGMKTLQAFMISERLGVENLPAAPDWVERVISATIVGLAVWYLNRLRGENDEFTPHITILFLLLLAIMMMPLGSAAALLLILTGYILGLRSLTIVGILAQIAYIVWYYYDMDISLLYKSLLLMGFGTVLLVVYSIVIKRGAKHV